MKMVVFVGPSLRSDLASRELEADYLPPAAQGDLYEAALQKPWGIGLIDGYFEWVPSVWHKEILWAMANGVHVFGASSMGALRAAELASFGMEGVGRIFEAYKSGSLEDDDEVALVHGPQDSGYCELSEAMVNMRATLDAATSAGIIDADMLGCLLEIAKRVFYADRTYERLLSDALHRGLSKERLRALETWIPSNRVNQKSADALEMLRRMKTCARLDPAPKTVSFYFRHTDAWDQLQRERDAQHQSSALRRRTCAG